MANKYTRTPTHNTQGEIDREIYRETEGETLTCVDFLSCLVHVYFGSLLSKLAAQVARSDERRIGIGVFPLP